MYQIDSKTIAIYFAFITVVIISISWASASSLNPLAVYSAGNILARIIVSFLLFVLAAQIMSLLVVALMKFWVSKVSGIPADNIRCPGCGNPLISFVSSHGMPIPCPKCNKFWHNGPACYNKGKSYRSRMVPTDVCPECRSSDLKKQNLDTGLDNFSM